jgi:hypothetical protein
MGGLLFFHFTSALLDGRLIFFFDSGVTPFVMLCLWLCDVETPVYSIYGRGERGGVVFLARAELHKNEFSVMGDDSEVLVCGDVSLGKIRAREKKKKTTYLWAKWN